VKFSDHFNIKRRKGDTWFDPILSLDTKLFIDPFLVYALERDEFKGSHKEVISFFNTVFQFIARAKGDESNLYWRRALNLLLFPEAEEFCIGYASQTTKGAGSGKGFAKIIAAAIWEAVKSGVTEIKHFEEVGILREGIGADRISDITATILKHRFAKYTNRICRRYRVPLKRQTYHKGKYDPRFERWGRLTIEVPLNPYNGRPVLLTPAQFLRDLPTISAENFWEYCWAHENQVLRDDYSADISRNVDKKTIVEFAQNHPEIRETYIKRTEKKAPHPYNLKRDTKGLFKWYDASAKYCSEHPKSIEIDSSQQFILVIDDFLNEFVNYVENNNGWKLLWNDNGIAKKEEAVQLLFLGIMKHYCKANDIDISKEVNIGRGPVDFKVSRGFSIRALLELKLAKNSRFWNGLKIQLPTYMKAEKIKVGFFLVVAYNKRDFKRINSIHRITREVSKQLKYKLQTIVIDASDSRLSASRIHA
jgi:hypothetical protein